MKALLLAPLLLALEARASTPATSTPDVSVTEDHRVQGEILVQAPADKVRKVLADPVQLAVIDGNTATIRLIKDGSCKTIHTSIAHPVASVVYTAEVCPTANGWRTEMLQSEDLESFFSEWSMEPVEGGVRLRYVVRTIPRIPVPQWIVDKQTRGSVSGMLLRLKTHLERP